MESVICAKAWPGIAHFLQILVWFMSNVFRNFIPLITIVSVLRPALQGLLLFTGVLDPEELSSIIEGAETCVKQNSFLPGIQEELSKSTDSISTFQSDLTLESLEADLFCDIRASIQRCSKSSTTGNSCGSKILRKEKSTDGCCKYCDSFFC